MENVRMFLWSCGNLNPVISDHLQLLTKNPTYRSKWEIIRAMPEAHYCGKSVGNSSAQMAETIVNTTSLPHRRHFAVADEKYFNHYIFPLLKCIVLHYFTHFFGFLQDLQFIFSRNENFLFKFHRPFNFGKGDMLPPLNFVWSEGFLLNAPNGASINKLSPPAQRFDFLPGNGHCNYILSRYGHEFSLDTDIFYAESRRNASSLILIAAFTSLSFV